jgi:predicted nucleic acid-binding protein
MFAAIDASMQPNILIDSSAWIEYFHGNEEYKFINVLLDQNLVCTNDIVLTELIPSIMHKKERELAGLLNAIYQYSLHIDWKEIRNIQIMNLEHGNNNIGISDIIIAQNCLQNDLEIIARDKHFRLMAAYLPLRLFDKKIMQKNE